MDEPYIELLDSIAGFNVWEVEGDFVRTNIDEEFTDFGQHYRFPYIPDNEFWVDKEADWNETQFYIDHMLVEYRLMARGVSYDKALEQADKAEQRERGITISMTWNNVPKDIGYFHIQLYGKTSNDVNVWIIDGDRVRTLLYTDFTEGGHDRVYKFIPSGEVWLDDDVEPYERGFILLHELHERGLMLNYRMSYDQAHRESSELEHTARQNPGMLSRFLSNEGWTYGNDKDWRLGTDNLVF